ncbi:MAG: hypothetical protein AAB551_02000 [Patescibacteria group bacterium]
MENQKKLIIGLIALVVVGAGVYFVSASNLKGDFFDRRTGRAIEKAPVEEQKVITGTSKTAKDLSSIVKNAQEVNPTPIGCIMGTIFAGTKEIGSNQQAGFIEKQEYPFQNLVSEIKDGGKNNCVYMLRIVVHDKESSTVEKIAYEANRMVFKGFEATVKDDGQSIEVIDPASGHEIFIKKIKENGQEKIRVRQVFIDHGGRNIFTIWNGLNSAAGTLQEKLTVVVTGVGTYNVP